jgi:hypothetical protein
MFVCCECWVLSGTGLCDELITRPGESYRLWCVVVCNLENLKNEEAMTRVGSQRHRKKIQRTVNSTHKASWSHKDSCKVLSNKRLDTLNLSSQFSRGLFPSSPHENFSLIKTDIVLYSIDAGSSSLYILMFLYISATELSSPVIQNFNKILVLLEIRDIWPKKNRNGTQHQNSFPSSMWRILILPFILQFWFPSDLSAL